MVWGSNPLGGTVLPAALRWSPAEEAERHRIPSCVRSKVRHNTEAFARDRGIALIDAETLDTPRRISAAETSAIARPPSGPSAGRSSP
jgi:Proto-chlorophyllide reductase 57 kD subunit